MVGQRNSTLTSLIKKKREHNKRMLRTSSLSLLICHTGAYYSTHYAGNVDEIRRRMGLVGCNAKLHHHLIALEFYVATEVEQQKRKEARENIEEEKGQGSMGSRRLID